MANIYGIEVSGDTYDIEDSQARQDLQTAESDIDGIERKIPSSASASNKLVTQEDIPTVTDSIAQNNVNPVSSRGVFSRLGQHFKVVEGTTSVTVAFQAFQVALLQGYVNGVGAFFAVAECTSRNGFEIHDIVGHLSQYVTVSVPSDWSATFLVDGAIQAFGLLS